MGTHLQKPWMKDLPVPVITLAKKKAVEATAAWNDTVAGILKSAKAVNEVREKIGGAPTGAFSAWAEEELQKSRQMASQLATIGMRYKELAGVSSKLPASWPTIWELAKAPDDVFRRALRRVKPDMERNEMICLVMEETSEDQGEAPRQKKKTTTTKAASGGTPRESEKETSEITPRQAANLTIEAGSVWRTVKDFSAAAEEALVAGVLSPEAKKFMVCNYIDPSVELLTALKAKIEAPPQV